MSKSPIAILPHIKNRPMTLKRYPEGIDKDHFYEKQCPGHKPDWVPVAHLWSRHNEGYIDYCLIDTVSCTCLARKSRFY